MTVPPPNIIDAAQAAYQKYKVLPSVQLGQFALESSWGRKCTGKYNFFGVKATPGQTATTCWTHEEINGKLVAILQRFKNYSCVQDAFDEHAELLSEPDGPYEAAIPYLGNLEQFVKIIGPIYATATNYAQNLLNLISVEGFQKYDTK